MKRYNSLICLWQLKVITLLSAYYSNYFSLNRVTSTSCMSHPPYHQHFTDEMEITGQTTLTVELECFPYRVSRRPLASIC